jgi:Skp family chaperone for outer membrane proteins
MKYILKLFIVLFFVTVSNQSYAEQKIVTLDLTFLLNESKAGKGAQDFLKKTYDSNAKKFVDIEKKLKKKEKDLLSKKDTLSKEDYSKEMNELRKSFSDYQTERRSSIDKLTKQRAGAREVLLKKLDPILKNYINENNVSLVIDKKIILGGAPDNDITKIIVEKINKELPSLDLK